MAHTAIHEDLKRQISNFRYDAHPMGMMVSLMCWSSLTSSRQKGASRLMLILVTLRQFPRG